MSDQANVRALAEAQLERLDSDLRVLSPVGVERAAWGWDRHDQHHLEAYRAAEQTALRATEQHAADAEWDEWRGRLFVEVEGQLALVAWKAEHQLHPEHVHKAERAA